MHLEEWPDAALFPADDALVTAMDRVREIASAGLGLRKAKSLRVRLPLARLTVVSSTITLDAAAEILRDELNVKEVVFELSDATSLDAFGITKKLTVNARALGPRLGKQVQEVIQAAKAGDWSLAGDVVTVGTFELLETEYELELESAGESAIAFLSDGFVILDTEITPELEAEGLARDVIRVIQDTRKAAGLEVSDRIELRIAATEGADAEALSAHIEMIAAETLATGHEVSLSAQPLDSPPDTRRATIEPGQYANGGTLVIDVRKAGPVNV